MRKLRYRLLIAAAAIGMGHANAWGQNGEKPKTPCCGDKSAVNFVLPGEFERALKLARENNRCLIIKGVAGGMDPLGATECTKGHW